jgi:hypothetical protein
MVLKQYVYNAKIFIFNQKLIPLVLQTVKKLQNFIGSFVLILK